MITFSSLPFVFISILSLFYTGNSMINPGDKPFEGIITYQLSVTGNLDEQTKSMIPRQLKMYYKGSKIRSEMISVFTQIAISDKQTKTSTILMDMMGQKYAMKNTKDDLENKLLKLPQIKVKMTSETKTIAGYTCTKAIITDSLGNVTEAFFTKQLGIENPNWGNEYKEIEGVLLEYTSHINQFTIRFTAQSVEQKTIDESLFEIPPDYKIVTQEQIKSMFGK